MIGPQRFTDAPPVINGLRHAEAAALVIDEGNRRMRNLLTMVGLVIAQTQANSVQEYQAEVAARVYRLSESYARLHGSDVTADHDAQDSEWQDWPPEESAPS